MQQQQPNEDTGYMPDQDSAVQASPPLTPVQFMGHAAAHHAGPPQMSQTSVLHHVGVPKQALSAPGSAPTGVLATSFSSKLSPSLLQINATSQQDVYSNAVQGRSQGTFISHPAGMAHHAKSGTTTSRQPGAARANGQEAGPVGIFSTRAAMLPLPKPTTASQESVPHSVPARLPAMMPYPAEVEVPIDPEALEREYQRVPKFGAAVLHADALMGHAAGMGLAPEQPERNLLFFSQQLQQLRSHAQEIGIASQPLAAALTARAAPPVQSDPPMHAAVDLPAHKHAASMGLAMGDVHARHLANAHAPAGPATTHASAHGPERLVPPGVSAATAVKAAAVSAAASRVSAWGCMEPPQEVQDALHAAGLALTDVDYRTMADLESSDAETAVSTALKDACLATAAAAAYERTCTARPSINSSHTRAPNRSLAAGHMPTAAGGQAQQQQHVKMEQGQQQQDQQQFLHVLQSRLKDMWRRKPPAPTQSKLHASVAPPMANPASAAADPRRQAYPAADAEPDAHAHAHAACLVDHSVHCTAGMSLPGDNAPAEHSYGHAGGAAAAAPMHHGQYEPAAAEALGDAAESSVKQQEQRQHVHHRQYASIHSAGDTGRVAGLRVRAPAVHELASSMYESSLEALGQAAHAWAARNAQRKGLTLAALQHDLGIPVHAAHAAAHPPAYLAAPHSPAGKATLNEHVLQQQTPAPAPYAQALRPSLLSHSANTPSIVYGPQAADLTAVGRLSSGSAAQAHTHARQPAQHNKHASQSHAMQPPCAAEAEAHPGIKQVDSMSELSQDCADVALALLSLQRGEQARVDTTPSAHTHDSTADASLTRQHREQDHQAGYDQAQNASHSLHRARASMASHPTTAITWPHHGITLPPAPPLIMPQLDYPSPTATPPPLRSMPSIPTPVSPPLLLPPGLSAVGLAAAPEQQVYAPVAGHSAITQHLLAKEGSSLQFGMLPQPQLQRPSANMLPRQEAMQASTSLLHLPMPLQLAGGLAKVLQTANNASGVSSTHDGLALPGLDSAVLGMLGASNETQPLSHATSAGQTVIQLPVGHHMEVMNAALQGHASCQPVLLQPALLQPALLSPTYTSPGARAAASAGGAGQPTGAVAGNAIAEGTACTARASQAAAPEQCHSPSLSQHPAQDRASPSLQGLASGPLQGSAAEEECDTHQDCNCPPSSELSKETLSVLARIAKLQPAALASTLRAEFPAMAMYARLNLMEQLLTQAGAVSSKVSASPIKAGENESV